jgi:hypothetical protein
MSSYIVSEAADPTGRLAATAGDKQERRVAPRKVLRRPAALRLAHGDVLPAKTIDVSSSGIAFSLAQDLRKGDLCVLRVDVLVGTRLERFEVSVEVMYCVLSNHDYKVGATFRDLGESAQDVLTRFLG